MSETKNKFDKKGARNMDEIAKTLFAPVYPVIAENLIRRLGITKGCCVDIGSGPASLAIAVARRTDLSVVALDYSDDMHEAASRNINEAGLSERICLICGDVHAMPLDDNSADLIISRGSMHFWDDIQTAFREIYRILKPGGKTYIGAGFGNIELQDEIFVAKIKEDPDWEEFSIKAFSPENAERFRIMLDEIGVKEYEIILGDEGFWIVISKTEPGALA